ncbi:MAG: hypothetical protein ABR992_03490 [Solirubrobacteraceae bacterium]|jgi:hypothetical protein
MGGNHGELSSSGKGPVDSPEQDGEPATPGERLGPVAIARHVKADGRALILYTVDRRSPS